MHSLSPLRTLPRAGWGLVLGAASLWLVGCAQVPDLPAPAAVKTAADWASARSLSSPSTVAWPQDRWWAGYGDAQLNALIDEALAQSPDLAAASARLAQAQALTEQADAASAPQLSANASISEEKLSYNYLTPRSMLPSGINDYGRATLNLSWELDFWGRHRAALAAATSQQAAREAELAQARLLLTSSVAAQYAELSRLYATRDTAAQAVAIRSKTAELLAQRLRNGLETKGSLRDAQARRAAAEGTLLAVDEQLALQRHKLATLLGAGPDRGLAIQRPSLQLDHDWGLPAQLGLDLLGRRPDITAARLLVQAQTSAIAAQRAEFYPNVNLSAFVGVQALGLNQLSDTGSHLGGVGPALSLPIFSGGRLEGALRSTQARHDELVALYHATVTHALQDVADNAVSQRALSQRLAKAQEAVDAASEAQRLARQRYEGGLISALDVLLTEDTLLSNLNQLTQLRAQALSLDIALQRALGGGYAPR